MLAAAEQAGVAPVPVHAISSAELNAPARRPAYSILSCAHIRRQCDIAQPEIDIQIDQAHELSKFYCGHCTSSGRSSDLQTQSSDRNCDRHSNGYMKEYMRRWRAKQK